MSGGGGFEDRPRGSMVHPFTITLDCLCEHQAAVGEDLWACRANILRCTYLLCEKTLVVIYSSQSVF